ncbi:MAG: geranylgeranyl reductase family protein [Actinomycetota bacterium]|nr:geranylgeranyl reductase family protein [Actinomycetota bacterium]
MTAQPPVPEPHGGSLRTDPAAPDIVDVVVVGAGPAGSAAAHWLARAGVEVVVLEQDELPRPKTCGDVLSPRAVRHLDEMGLGSETRRFHRHDGIRIVAHEVTVDVPWPDHPELVSHGCAVRRGVLDELVARQSARAGASLRTGQQVEGPLLRDGLLQGVSVLDRASGETYPLGARYVIVADGARSPLGRALGTRRDHTFPQAMAERGYYASPRHAEPWLEVVIDLRDRDAESLGGYGWAFPLGDGAVNVGVGTLALGRSTRHVQTEGLLEQFASTIATPWDLDPSSPLEPPAGGRLPMAGSVGPKSGPTWLVVGDAAASVNPFSGEGISAAYETGRMAAETVVEALATGDGSKLADHTRRVDETYGLYNRTARLFARAIEHPSLISELTRVGIQSRSLLEWAVRIMADMLRTDELGPAEAAYRTAARVVRLMPDSSTS